MKLVIPAAVQLADVESHAVEFRAARGERFRVTALEHDLIRVQFMPDRTPRQTRTWAVCGASGDTPREGRLRDDLTPFSVPQYGLTPFKDGYMLHTESLNLTIRTGDFSITWADADGQAFAADLPRRAYAYDARGRAVWHYLKRTPDEHYYGFGEPSGAFDKHGARIRMFPKDALGYDAETGDPLYKHWPFYITYNAALNIAYGIFYDTYAESVFDMGREINALIGAHRYHQAADGDIDYYLIYGPSIEQVIEKFTALTGRPALLPRYTLGYMASTMLYTEAPDAQRQLENFLDELATHQIPCDLFHMSSGYTTDETGARLVFNWNNARVPDPHGLSAKFHAAGVRLAANIKPHLLTMHPRFDEVAAHNGFIRDSENDSPALNICWRGGLEEFGDGAFIDFTSAAGFDWWKARCKYALLDYGIDALWNDNNEFEVYDDGARCDGFGEMIPASLARPLNTLLMARSSYEALREHHPDRRPFVITRSATVGAQRYAQTWSGDNFTSWTALKFNQAMGLSLSVSGMPSVGHDVGGFVGGRPDAELFLRWVQAGIFWPRFTIHSLAIDGEVNTPWMHPEILTHVRDLLRLRYTLIPYLYSLTVEAHRTGHPIMRPLVYHYPHDPRTHRESFDYLLGADLLVAAVTEAGVTAREVYLPHGADWIDWHTGALYSGGQTVTVPAPLNAQPPLFARAGAVIPMGQGNTRIARVFLPVGEGEVVGVLIEDDGETMAYASGGQTVVTLRAVRDALGVSVSAAAQGGYALPYASIRFEIVGTGEIIDAPVTQAE